MLLRVEVWFSRGTFAGTTLGASDGGQTMMNSLVPRSVANIYNLEPAGNEHQAVYEGCFIANARASSRVGLVAADFHSQHFACELLPFNVSVLATKTL